MKKINVGLIGYGYWGPNYARILNSHEQINFLALADLDKTLLKEAKVKHRVATFDDYRKILKDPKIDAVVIVTPSQTHYQISKDALKYKKHVLVEKPLAIKGLHAQKLYELSQKDGLILMVGHTFLYNNHFEVLKKKVKEGELGDLRFITSTRINLGPIRNDVNALWDLAPHDIAMILDLVEETPIEVAAFGQGYLRDGVSDVGFIHLKFPKNVVANLVVSWLSPIKTRQLTIVGSKKMAVFDDLKPKFKLSIFNKTVMIPRGSSFTDFKKFGIYSAATNTPRIIYQEPLLNKVDHFIECIKNSKTPLSDGLQGLNVVKILEACNLSIKKGKKIIFKK